MIGRRTIVPAVAAGLTVVLIIFSLAPATLAGVISSAHDFTGSGFVEKGACSACHLAHDGEDPQLLWPRDLTDERTEFDQGDTGIETPNYIRGATLLCYDCHDNQNVIDVDDDPDPIFWGGSIHGGPDGYPQDIAFDDHPGAQGSGVVGYYELDDGSLPPGVSFPVTDPASPTGGHFWMSVPANGGSPEYEQGDKLACDICHDPHDSATGTNDVMLRTSTSDGMGGTVDLGDGRTASVNTRARVGQDPRINNGRNMCAACHRYSDEPNAAGATADGIPTTTVEMWNVPLPQPPTTDPNHAYDANATVACTTCHRHNRIVASCDDCHGFPPTDPTNPWHATDNPDGYSYVGGAGAHMAHKKGVGNPDADPDLYNFGCLGGACHPANPGEHPQGFGGDPTDVRKVNVQVAFNPNWNPNGVYDGPSQGCSQLYCHSNGLVANGEYGGVPVLGEYAETSGGAAFYGPTISAAVTWTDTFAGLGINPCGACHGKSDTAGNGVPDYQLEINGVPQTRQKVSAPDYYNAGVQAITDGATIYNSTGANTHFIHVYKINSQGSRPALDYGMWGGGPMNDDLNIGCGCHALRDQRDPATGFSYHVDLRVSIGDGAAVDATGASNSVGRGCNAKCHNVDTQADWGAAPAAYLSTDNDSCVFVCHGGSNSSDTAKYAGSAGGRITKVAGGGAQDSDDKYMESGHGLPVGNYASGNPAADLACAACHLLNDRAGGQPYHYESLATATGNPNAPFAPGQPAANPYLLQTGYESDPDGLCESCHDPAPPGNPHNHTAQGMISYGEYDPKYDNDTGAWSTGIPGTFDPMCVHCHDPHGDSNRTMIYDSDAEKSTHDTNVIYSGPVIHEGTRHGITSVGADQHGLPPGPPYDANQTGVVFLDNTDPAAWFNLPIDAVNDGLCQVCHTETELFLASGSGPKDPHNHATLCTECHKHSGSFAPSGCEFCHNGVPPPASVECFDPDGGGPLPPAPNVMGDGVNFDGVGGIIDDDGGILPAQPFDDGTWGYNVNGHGAMNWDVMGRTVACSDCHPTLPGTHNNGTLHTLSWPGKAADTRLANTSHLAPGFFSGASASAQQVNFDNYCTNQCHTDAREMRHSAPAAPTHPSYDGIMEFGQATSEANPKIVRAGWTLWGDGFLTANDCADPNILDEKFTPGVGPGGGDPTSSYWFPWTISDLTNGAAAPPYYGTCVSCHDPHGTPTTDQSRGQNHMVRYNWKTPPISDKNFSCNSMCHGSKP